MKKFLPIALFCLCFLGCSKPPKITFDNNPCLVPSHGYRFTLCSDMRFHINGKLYIIKKNFDTDLASIPRVLWSIYSPLKTETIAPAVMHDFFYNCISDVTRDQADSYFYYGLRKFGMPSIRAWFYWAGVHIFGESAYSPVGPCKNGA